MNPCPQIDYTPIVLALVAILANVIQGYFNYKFKGQINALKSTDE